MIEIRPGLDLAALEGELHLHEQARIDARERLVEPLVRELGLRLEPHRKPIAELGEAGGDRFRGRLPQRFGERAEHHVRVVGPELLEARASLDRLAPSSARRSCTESKAARRAA